jgi:hypothetical protein
MEQGWQEFAALLSVASNAAVNQGMFPQPESSSDTTHHLTPSMLQDYDTRRRIDKYRPAITATLPKRDCRVQFMIGKKLVHISPEYKSCNTWDKIIAYARSKRGGAPANLPPAALAIPQVLTVSGWIAVKE